MTRQNLSLVSLSVLNLELFLCSHRFLLTYLVLMRKQLSPTCRLKESGAINSSLFALGQVVDALNQGLVGLEQFCIKYRTV